MIYRSPVDARNAVARRFARLCAGVLLALLAVALASGRTRAADMPENYLRGAITEPPARYVNWDGLNLGAQIGYSNLTTDFSTATSAVTLPSTTTNSVSYGGFIGYNIQWDELVLGVDGTYTRPSSLATSVSNGATNSATYKLNDYATVRGRAGYAFGQFLPYGFVGAGVGRFNYAIASAGSTNSRDNAYAAGFTAGLGIDVAIMPNIFLRAEYEYVAFSELGFTKNTVFGGIRSSLNTARVGLGVRF
jgi:opacity protein-like surface antigen